jgi:CRISPR/Cas system-associated exonuclease Cas4 (RecB family)
VEETAKGIAENVFDAKPGQHCNFCAYRSLCPEKEKRIPRLQTVKA